MPYYVVVQSVVPLQFVVRKYNPEGPGENLGSILVPSPLHAQPNLVRFTNGTVALISGDITGHLDRILPVVGSFNPDSSMLIPSEVKTIGLPHIKRQNAITNRLNQLAQSGQPLGMYYS
jgi:hypothetical protein